MLCTPVGQRTRSVHMGRGFLRCMTHTCMVHGWHGQMQMLRRCECTSTQPHLSDVMHSDIAGSLLAQPVHVPMLPLQAVPFTRSKPHSGIQEQLLVCFLGGPVSSFTFAACAACAHSSTAHAILLCAVVCSGCCV